jgi:agmatinase
MNGILREVHFVDEKNGWVVELNGSILHTSDSGENWSVQSGAPALMYSIYFADANSEFEDSGYIIYGVPFDATVSHRPGTSKAPSAIRYETYNFETYLMDLDVDLDDIRMCDMGDLSVLNNVDNQSSMIGNVHDLTGYILDKGKMPIMMGGEHSASEGSMNAFLERYASKGGLVVIVDAHMDFRDSYMDNIHSHACISRRIFERFGRESICLIGIRSGCREEFHHAKEKGLRYATANQVRLNGMDSIIDQWDTGFSIKDRPVYLSIDVDGMDPAYAPGTGTPEPWGISSIDVLKLLEELHMNTIAMDIVEVSPDVEAFATAGLAGKIIRQMIGLKERDEKNPTWLEKI